MRFFSILKASLAKLAFWGKPRVVGTEDADVAPPLVQGEPSSDVSELLAPPTVNNPGWFTRLKQRLPWRRIPTPPAVAQDSRLIKKPALEELTGVEDDVSDASAPSAKFSWLSRLKTRFALPRKPKTEDSEQSPNIENQDKPLVSKSTTGQGPKAEVLPAAPDKRFKRILVRLRNKWVWLPATGIALLALFTAVVLNLAQATHERERLKAELQIAKKKLEQKANATIVVAKMVPPIPPASATETKKTEPLNEHVAEARAETNPGIDAGDCVVKDKTSVVQNLKNCIEGFNSAMANSPEKTRKR